MGRNWKPKYKVECNNCGWVGKRANVYKKCPKCNYWYPKKKTSQEKMK